jgi:hypothetical protein
MPNSPRMTDFHTADGNSVDVPDLVDVEFPDLEFLDRLPFPLRPFGLGAGPCPAGCKRFLSGHSYNNDRKRILNFND